MDFFVRKFCYHTNIGDGVGNGGGSLFDLSNQDEQMAPRKMQQGTL